MAPKRTYGKYAKVYVAPKLFNSLIDSPGTSGVDNVTNGLRHLEVKDDAAEQGSQRQPLGPINGNRKCRRASNGDSKSKSNPTKSKIEVRIKANPVRKQHQRDRASLCDAGGCDATRESSRATSPSPETKTRLDYASQTPHRTTSNHEPSHTTPCPPTPTPTPTPAPSLHDSLSDDLRSHIAPLLPFTTTPITPFSTFSTTLSAHFTITKIAEASFSQVFSLHTPLLPTGSSILKLIPLLLLPAAAPPVSSGSGSSSDRPKPSRAQARLLSLSSNPSAVATETRLLAHLTSVPGFTAFRALHLVAGRPGAAFVKACRAWNVERRAQGKEASWFPDPGRQANYGADMLWAVVEMGDAGADLEQWLLLPEAVSSDMSSSSSGGRVEGGLGRYGVVGVWDVFWQVVLAAGKGEVSCGWESRDLHCGNICVRRSPRGGGARKGAGDDGQLRGEMARRLERGRRKVGLSGLEVTVIDYTISRAEVLDDNGEREVAYIDLDEDESLFQGDGRVEYQYDIYRFMRAAAVLGDPLGDQDQVQRKKVGNSWRDFHPETNVVWLHFVLFKLLENYEWRYSQGTQTQGTQEDALAAREHEMEQVMRRLQGLLKLENWASSGIRSAGDLVKLALKEQWLELEDVVGLFSADAPKKRSKMARSKPKVTAAKP